MPCAAPGPIAEGTTGDCRFSDSRYKDESALRQAFRAFSKVAGSLEQSYGQLQGEVKRLRRELAERDGDLASSVEERQNERDRLVRILAGLPCGVLVVFDNGVIWKANPAALRLLESVFSCPQPLESLSELPAGLAQFLESVRSEGGEHEMNISSPAGAVIWIAARHGPIGKGMSVFILRDTSEHRRLEEAQQRMRRNQALAEISAMLAHEIRNPLASLELFAGLLADTTLEPESRNCVEHVQAGLRTLAATVNNVLSFHSMPRPKFHVVEAGELLNWLLNFCGPLARRSGVSLKLGSSTIGLSLWGDRHGLEQVLLNLALNSIRAMPDGGLIEVSACAAAGSVTGREEVEISVADDGPGIPAEHLSKIFEPGFSTSSGSPGLGLAVCRRIVEQQGGILRAERRAPRGTRMSFVVPRTESPEASA